MLYEVITVALVSAAIGLAIGILAGYIRWLDNVVMRVMDGLMAVPAILLAIALVSLSNRITSYNVCYTKLLRQIQS